MKNIILTLFFALFFIACTKDEKTTIRFDIRDYDGTAPRVIVGSSNQGVEIEHATGKGFIELELKEPAYAKITVRKYDSKLCFLEPGKELTLAYSQKKGEKEIVYGGTLGEENQFLNQVKFYDGVCVDYKNHNVQVIARRADSVLAVNKAKLEKTSYSATFKAWEGKRLQVETWFPVLRTRELDTAVYLQTIRQCFVEDSTYLSLPNYREFLEQYVRTLVRLGHGTKSTLEGEDWADARLKMIFDNFQEPAIVGYLVDVTLFHFAERGIERYEKIYNQHVKDAARLALYAEACKKADRIAPGQPCPDFSFADNTGKTVTLADLKGKFVYIDMWATWCGPCKGEMPSLLELEKRFEGKDILFVSLSIDKNKDIELWKQTIEKMGLGGIQLHLGENWDWLKIFMPASMSVPRFVLLDREGKFIDANMTRPSDKATAERLEALL
ncbi:TlpA disulfide reductase family protein [Butyricimonas hominis]|uniref:TlpA family protein disulfide reductase n=1 Tax=Butyricimonas TaxID=574697 RepID=UPI003518053F